MKHCSSISNVELRMLKHRFLILETLRLVPASNNMQLNDTMIGRKSARGQYKIPEGICHLVTTRFNESIHHLQLLVMTRISCNYR